MIQSHVSFKLDSSLYARRGHVVGTIWLKSDEITVSGLKDGKGSHAGSSMMKAAENKGNMGWREDVGIEPTRPLQSEPVLDFESNVQALQG